MLSRCAKRGRNTTPKVLESAVSLVRLGLPEVMPCAVAFTTFEVKGWVIPAAAQFAARCVGFVPWLMKRASHGSFANSKFVDPGRNSSVIAGARTERVLLPRNRMSWIGAQRSP